VKSLEIDWLPKLLTADTSLAPVAPDDPLLSGKVEGTDKLVRLSIRASVTDADTANVKLQVATIGKGRIIYCSGDLISGMLGINTLGINGFRPSTAMSIMKNAVLLSESLSATP
jgi:hypothetical protein